MAKYYSSTFGKISGKHGSAVAVIKKDGSTYLRLYAKSSNPRTEKQQAHRAKFALTSKSLAPFNPIFKKTMGAANGISIARSHAFKNAIVGDYPSFSIDYEKLMFSFGTIENLHNVFVTHNNDVLTMNWSFEKKYNCHKSDSVSLVVFNKDTNQTALIEDIAKRSDRTAIINIPDVWADAELYFWVYVTHGDKVSDSVFVGASLDIESNSVENDSVEAIFSKDKCVEDMHRSTSVHSAVSEFVLSFIMMLYNLVGLLRQAFSFTANHCSPRTLICNELSEVSDVEDMYKERGLSLNSNSTTNTVFGRVCGIYHSMFMVRRVFGLRE